MPMSSCSRADRKATKSSYRTVFKGGVVRPRPEARHPYAIAEEYVIQQGMNAPERARTLAPIFLVFELCAGCVKSLVGDAVIVRQHLE